jgi:hypothetical protein
MPDFTVIEGGGEPTDYDALAAQDAFRMLSIEIIRAMVRGEDVNGKIGKKVIEFNQHLRKSRKNLFEIIDGTMREMRKDLSPDRDFDAPSFHVDRIVSASLQVAAETCCFDNAAEGRRGSRENNLFAAIKGFNEWRPRRR